MPGPVVVGYDGSDAARRALTAAAELAGERAVVVINAVASLYPRPYAVTDEREEERGELLLAEAKELLAERGRESETRTVTGEAGEVLVDTARERDASLLVVGRRRSAASHLLGSVSEHAVRHAPCDVLVVR